MHLGSSYFLCRRRNHPIAACKTSPSQRYQYKIFNKSNYSQTGGGGKGDPGMEEETNGGGGGGSHSITESLPSQYVQYQAMHIILSRHHAWLRLCGSLIL